MLWAPGVGIGYPYLGEQYPMQCDIYPDECAALDTNGDGNITQSDDMYDPYWPGAEYVDFVGMSVYWFGEVSICLLHRCVPTRSKLR